MWTSRAGSRQADDHEAPRRQRHHPAHRRRRAGEHDPLLPGAARSLRRDAAHRAAGGERRVAPGRRARARGPDEARSGARPPRATRHRLLRSARPGRRLPRAETRHRPHPHQQGRHRGARGGTLGRCTDHRAHQPRASVPPLPAVAAPRALLVAGASRCERHPPDRLRGRRDEAPGDRGSARPARLFRGDSQRVRAGTVRRGAERPGPPGHPRRGDRRRRRFAHGLAQGTALPGRGGTAGPASPVRRGRRVPRAGGAPRERARPACNVHRPRAPGGDPGPDRVDGPARPPFRLGRTAPRSHRGVPRRPPRGGVRLRRRPGGGGRSHHRSPRRAA